MALAIAYVAIIDYHQWQWPESPVQQLGQLGLGRLDKLLVLLRQPRSHVVDLLGVVPGRNGEAVTPLAPPLSL